MNLNKRYFSSSKGKTKFSDLFKLIKPERKQFYYGAILTVGTSGIAMLFP